MEAKEGLRLTPEGTILGSLTLQHLLQCTLAWPE
jgi:hypothetical protein